MKPRALDLFCGAGGASMGLHRAGFDVYCGKVVHAAGEPYCSTHRARAWVKAATRPGAPSELVLPGKRSAILQTIGD